MCSWWSSLSYGAVRVASATVCVAGGAVCVAAGSVCVAGGGKQLAIPNFVFFYF